MSDSALVLPYITDEKGREKRFSSDLEISAILCLTEAERRKKTGLFKGAVEALSLLSKLHFPMWLVPWRDKCQLIDGMENIQCTIQYYKPPDVEAFVEHLKRSSTAYELYRNALRSHRDTFSDFLSKTETPVRGLVTDKGTLSEISAFISESRPEAGRSTSLMHPSISREEALRIVEKISEHHNELECETKGLQYAIDALNEETGMHAGKLGQELEQIREKYGKKLAVLKTEVDERTRELEKEKKEKTEKIASTNKTEVEGRLKEKRKWEQEHAKLEQDKSEYEKRKELRKRKKDEVGATRWGTRLREVKSQISTVKGKIDALSDFINRSNKETEKTIRDVCDTYQKLMVGEENRVRNLEKMRDEEIKEKEREMEELRQETSAISSKIGLLIDQKRKQASILEEATVPCKNEAITLVQVPFYMIQYETQKEKRYRVHPPAYARAPGGIVTKIRKTLQRYSLQSKIGALLKTRSRALETMLASFEERLNRDKNLQMSVTKLSEANNLLASPDFKERVMRGLGELEAEGWIKPEERNAILSIYAP